MIIPKATGTGHAMGESRSINLATHIDGISKLVYVPIPKNASCWVKYHFGEADLCNYYTNEINNNEHLSLVVLRDPFERWVSGLAQHLAGWSPGHPLNIDSLNWETAIDQVVFDEHTQHQHEFIANLLHDNIVWFKCDNNLPINFIDFMKKYNINIKLLNEEEDTTNIFNITKKVQARTNLIDKYEAPPQQTLVDKIISKLNENPKYLDRIRKFYQDDYKLYNTVPYYAAR